MDMYRGRIRLVQNDAMHSSIVNGYLLPSKILMLHGRLLRMESAYDSHSTPKDDALGKSLFRFALHQIT